MMVILRFEEGDGNVRFVVEDVIGPLGFTARDQLARTMIRPLVKDTSSRIWDKSSQPAFLMAGVMNFVQMSRSERSFFISLKRNRIVQNTWGVLLSFCIRPGCFLFPHIRSFPNRVSPNQCHSRYIKGRLKATANLQLFNPLGF